MEKEDIGIVKDIIRRTMSDYRIEEMQKRVEDTVLYTCIAGFFITGLFIGVILGRIW